MITIRLLLSKIKKLLKINRNLILIQILIAIIGLLISLYTLYKIDKNAKLKLVIYNVGWEGERINYTLALCNTGNDVASDAQVLLILPDSIQPGFTCYGMNNSENRFSDDKLYLKWSLIGDHIYMPSTGKEPYSLIIEPKFQIYPSSNLKKTGSIKVWYYINHSKGSVHKSLILNTNPPR